MKCFNKKRKNINRKNIINNLSKYIEPMFYVFGYDLKINKDVYYITLYDQSIERYYLEKINMKYFKDYSNIVVNNNVKKDVNELYRDIKKYGIKY